MMLLHTILPKISELEPKTEDDLKKIYPKIEEEARRYTRGDAARSKNVPNAVLEISRGPTHLSPREICRLYLELSGLQSQLVR